ncbi:hypothetical protein [Pseudomonas gessardii]|uniref:hypothetical protein n=1 Tax=Pseudomonas gessardii TaxID=78544 RepID=UPI001475892E|nr:hypothetical protein [Pseudomonas gessardii]NNA92842.1 hypothetical protein [Pseudomonas gessardii]
MTATPFPLFDDQPELPNARAQTAWQQRLRDLASAKERQAVHRIYNNSAGYVQALRDSELIQNDAEFHMTATLVREWKAAMDRVDAEEGVGGS